MKAFKIIGTGIFLLLLFNSCKKEMQASDFVRYVNNPENGLHKIKQVDDLIVDLQYKPLEYIVSHEFRTNNIEAQAFRQRAEKLQGLQYYNLKLSIDEKGLNPTTYNIQNDLELQNRLYYLSFGMKQDIRLIQGRDTLSPVLYHFERSYNLSKHRTFVLAFDEKDMEHELDKTFVLDSPDFGTGPVKIKIQKDDLQNTPSLKLL